MDNYVEDLVEEWLRFKGYVTCRDVPIWKPKGEHRKQSQWGDIDVLGIRDDEALVVECKEFLGTKKVKEWPEELSREFNEIEAVLTGRVKNPYGVPCPDLSGKRIKRLLVAAAPENIESYKKHLSPLGIETKSLKEVLKETLNYLSEHSRGTNYGKYRGLIRFLITLMRYGFIKYTEE
ncbi:MAG: hypothetical protein ACTSWF_12080 [Candidatus Freyarchaeota archaeon]